MELAVKLTVVPVQIFVLSAVILTEGKTFGIAVMVLDVAEFAQERVLINAHFTVVPCVKLTV